MFFSPWYLSMRPRDDRTKTVVGDVFVLISTADFLEVERESIQQGIYKFAAILAVIFGLFIIVFGFMYSNWIANKYSGVIMKQISEASKSILEFNYSLAKQKYGKEEKLKNIINKREVAEEKLNSKNELDSIMKILSKFVRLFRIHYINLTKLDDKELQNQILLEYLMAKKKTGHNNRW